MTEENIYAPPKTIIDPNQLRKTTYLEHDGYSENCMLLCNEHFKTPNLCLKTGAQIDPENQPVSLCVSRFLPRFKDSSKVRKSWFIRVLLLLSLPFFIENKFWTLLILTFFLLTHKLLQFYTSEKIILPVYVDEKVMWRKNITLLILTTAAIISVFFYMHELIYFDSQEHLIISLAALFLTTKFVISSSCILKFVRKKGDFYYLRGAHPHFLAALPLRSFNQ